MHRTIRACGSVVVLLLCGTALLGDTTDEKGVPPEVALKRLKEGNARFAEDHRAPRPPFSVQRAKLLHKQRPFAVVLTCSDSRLTATLLFDQQLGDLFAVRVAGNLTSPEILASIEYAVSHLGSRLVVVVGHTGCGAVKAALSGEKAEGNLAALLKRVDVGTDASGKKPESLDDAVHANVRRQARNLVEQSTILKDFAASGRIRIVGGVCSLKTGKVEWLKSPASGGKGGAKEDGKGAAKP
jgi:carbonic anhydrase